MAGIKEGGQISATFLRSRNTPRCTVRVSSVELSLVQFKMVFVRSEKPICAPPRLSEVFPTLPLKLFRCSSS